MLKFFFYALVFGALFCAWNVLLCAGRAARALSRSHPDTLALRGLDG